MVRFPTLVLGATLGLAALGLSATASAGVRVGVDVGLPVVAPGAAFVAYHPAPYYHGPRFYGAPYYGRNYGPERGYPRGPALGWHGAYAFRDGHGWHR